MISAPDADAAFSAATDLGDCAQILRQRFPKSTAEDRVEAIRAAQSRVLEKLFGKRRRSRKKWWLMTLEQELAERDRHGR